MNDVTSSTAEILQLEQKRLPYGTRPFLLSAEGVASQTRTVASGDFNNPPALSLITKVCYTCTPEYACLLKVLKLLFVEFNPGQ